MPNPTTSYSFQKPIVGSELDSWGDTLNANWDKCDDLFDGTITVNGIDIDGGAIDGTPIGANSASTGAFTTLSASGDITGNLKGDILSPDGTVILDSGTTDGADATFTGTASSLLNCTATGAELSTLASSGMTAEKMANLADLSVAEVDILDDATITTTELNYLANATSEIQTQLDGKQATLTAGDNVSITSNTIAASGVPFVVIEGLDNITDTTGNYLLDNRIPQNTQYKVKLTDILYPNAAVTGSPSLPTGVSINTSDDTLNLPEGAYYVRTEIAVNNHFGNAHNDGVNQTDFNSTFSLRTSSGTLLSRAVSPLFYVSQQQVVAFESFFSIGSGGDSIGPRVFTDTGHLLRLGEHLNPLTSEVFCARLTVYKIA